MRFLKSGLLPALLVVAGTAAAQPWHGHGGDELTRGVTLTETQQAQIKTIEKNSWAQARPIMEQARSIHEQIVQQMLGSNSVTEADLAPLVQQEESLRTQLDQQRVAAGLQIRQVLTPAQLTDAANKHQQLAALHDQAKQIMQAPEPN